MTDDPTDTGDSTDPVVVDPTPDPTPDPVPPVAEDPFVPTLTVVQQGEWRIITQERTAGNVQTVILDPDQAKSTGWALLSADQATQDAVGIDPNVVNVGGRFT